MPEIQDTFFGDSAVDRRKNRSELVTADEHYRLSRRVGDLRDRIGSIERWTHELSESHTDLRGRVMDVMGQLNTRIEQIVDWTRTRDHAERERQWVTSLLMVSNFMALLSFIIWLMVK